MNSSQAIAAGRLPNPVCHPRPRTVTKSVALPETRSEALELRELLEANLHALNALHEEHRRMLDTTLRSIDGACLELRADLRAIASVRAPWIAALTETRALLYVALRELIVGSNEAELSRHLPSQAAAEAPPQVR